MSLLSSSSSDQLLTNNDHHHHHHGDPQIMRQQQPSVTNNPPSVVAAALPPISSVTARMQDPSYYAGRVTVGGSIGNGGGRDDSSRPSTVASPVNYQAAATAAAAAGTLSSSSSSSPFDRGYGPPPPIDMPHINNHHHHLDIHRDPSLVVASSLVVVGAGDRINQMNGAMHRAPSVVGGSSSHEQQQQQQQQQPVAMSGLAAQHQQHHQHPQDHVMYSAAAAPAANPASPDSRTHGGHSVVMMNQRNDDPAQHQQQHQQQQQHDHHHHHHPNPMHSTNADPATPVVYSYRDQQQQHHHHVHDVGRPSRSRESTGRRAKAPRRHDSLRSRSSSSASGPTTTGGTGQGVGQVVGQVGQVVVGREFIYNGSRRNNGPSGHVANVGHANHGSSPPRASRQGSPPPRTSGNEWHHHRHRDTRDARVGNDGSMLPNPPHGRMLHSPRHHPPRQQQHPQAPPQQQHPQPPQQQRPSSNLIVDPDLLILDVRSYRKLEDAVVQVKLFLENVRHLAVERGLLRFVEDANDNDDGRKPSLFVTIITGEGADGTPSQILRSVLHQIFTNRRIQFAESDAGDSLQIDALSGIRDEYDSAPPPAMMTTNDAAAAAATTTAGTNNNNDHGPIDRDGNDHGGIGAVVVPPRDQSLPPNASDNNVRLAVMMLEQARLGEEKAAGALASPVDDDDSQRLKAMLMMQAEALRRQHQQQQQQHHPSSSSSNRPYPQDQGAGMLYNPFDSIAHSLMERDLSRDSSAGSGSSNAYYNALSGAPTALGMAGRGDSGKGVDEGGSRDTMGGGVEGGDRGRRRGFDGDRGDRGDHDGRSKTQRHVKENSRRRTRESSRKSAGTGTGGGGEGEGRGEKKKPAPSGQSEYPAGLSLLAAHQAGRLSYRGDGQYHQSQQVPLPMASPEDNALRSAILGQSLPCDGGGGASSNNNNERNSDPASDNNNNNNGNGNNGNGNHSPAPAPQRRRHRRPPRRNRPQESEVPHPHAIIESQDARLAHMQRQLRELGPGPEDEGAPPPGARSVRDLSEDELIRRASHKTFLEEQQRKREAEARYAYDLEQALRQSEELTRRQREEAYDLEQALRQSEELTRRQREEEERIHRAEEELLRDVLAKTKMAEEQALRNEQEFLRMALVRSMAEEEDVDEDDLMKEVIRASLSERDHRGRSGADDASCTEKMIERALKLSLEESEHMSPEEEEDLRKAMHWSSLEEQCYAKKDEDHRYGYSDEDDLASKQTPREITLDQKQSSDNDLEAMQNMCYARSYGDGGGKDGGKDSSTTMKASERSMSNAEYAPGKSNDLSMSNEMEYARSYSGGDEQGLAPGKPTGSNLLEDEYNTPREDQESPRPWRNHDHWR